MILTLLAILIAALAVLGALGVVLPRKVVVLGCTCAAVLVILLALTALADRAGMTALALPLGPFGASMRLSLDPLSACFLLLLSLGALACALCGEISPILLAAMVLAVLAADAFTLATGLLLLGSAGSLRLATFGVVCLIVALALAAPASVAWPDGGFAAIRAAPPEGWRAGAMLVLVTLAAGIQVGILARTSPLPAVASSLAIYLPMRLLLDLGGPAQPVWSGVLLLVPGAIAVVLGPLRAAFEPTLQSALSACSLHQLGMAAVGVGIALLARATDRPDITMLALQAAWLWLVCYVLYQTLLLLCATAVESGVGTRRLDRLGGLVHGMPLTTMCTLTGLLGVAMLPPAFGFAAFWLMFQSLLAIARSSGLGLQYLVAMLAALTAISVGVTAMAAVRLFGVAFLGRPRTPRTAVAEEAPRPVRLVLGALAGSTALLGVFPALALLPAAPALGVLAGGNAAPLDFPLRLQPSAEAPGYSPIAVAVLLVLAASAIFWGLRRTGARERRREAAWSGGFVPPPTWLPFGDPATQYGPTSFVEPLRRILALLPAIGQFDERCARYGRALMHAATLLRNGIESWSVSAALGVIVLATVVWAMAA